MIDTNLTAAFRCARAVHPNFVEAGHGKIINIGSEYSLFGSATVLPYSASKGGIIQLTKSLAVAWAPRNIQVNAIIPGWIRTDMTAGVQRMEDFYRQIVQRTPAGRFGDPEELAGAGVFLASRASDFVTGVVLPVDGATQRPSRFGTSLALLSLKPADRRREGAGGAPSCLTRVAIRHAG